MTITDIPRNCQTCNQDFSPRSNTQSYCSDKCSRASRLRDLSNQKFGELFVLQRDTARPSPPTRWLCQCSCGQVTSVRASHLLHHAISSCGCRRLARLAEANTKTRHARNGKVQRTYKIWAGMKSRCLNQNSHAWPDYGGRGIEICERWLDYENFLADMGQPPTHTHTLDRKDNDGHYSPENCRWATPTEQMRNRRNNRRITHEGETACLAEWAERLAMSAKVLARKLGKYSIEEIVTPPASRVLSLD